MAAFRSIVVKAFVIGHEVAHNLSLSHVVDDPNISDTIPNLLGEGLRDSLDPRLAKVMERRIS